MHYTFIKVKLLFRNSICSSNTLALEKRVKCTELSLSDEGQLVFLKGFISCI